MTGRFPAADWLARYERPWLKADVVAGLTTAAVVIPKAMAYATIAGLPVQIGLYTALVPMVVYAVLGTSRPLSVSTTTTLGILCASALGEAVPHAEPAALITTSATLAMMVGAILLVARLLRLGFVANFISDPVLTGFKAGIGLVIVLDQLPKLLGIHIDKAGWFRDAASIVRHLPETSVPTLAVALATLAVVSGSSTSHPGCPRRSSAWPAASRRPRSSGCRRRASRSSDTSREACRPSSRQTWRSSSSSGRRRWRSRS